MSKILPLCLAANCAKCFIHSSCPMHNSAVSENAVRPLNHVYRQNESVYVTGETFKGIYIMRSGSAVSSLISEQGDEQITGFIHPGEAFGIDGYASGKFNCTVRILETSSLCFINSRDFYSGLINSRDVFDRFLKEMCHTILSEYHLRLALTNQSAERRLATFFVEMVTKLKKLKRCTNPLYLSMSRRDLANYLGMALETVSRQLKAMEERQMITVKCRTIYIHDLEALQQDFLKPHDAVKQHAMLTPQDSAARVHV